MVYGILPGSKCKCGLEAEKTLSGDKPWIPGIAWQPVCNSCHDAHYKLAYQQASAYLAAQGAPSWILKMGDFKKTDHLVASAAAGAKGSWCAALFSLCLAGTQGKSVESTFATLYSEVHDGC